MSDHNLYLLINLGTISVPFLCSFYAKAHFAKTWKRILPAIFIPLLIFITWDHFFTEWGIWGFNPSYVLGFDILGLPFEEWLFFITVPYASLFTYFALKHLYPVHAAITPRFTIALGFVILLAGLWFLSKAYTSTTFISTGLFLLYLGYKKKSYLTQFFLSYAVVLVPFFIVNGLLTGSWIDEQVVWYNNAENLGIRLFTIPVEDAFYGMLLLLMNTVIWEETYKLKT